MLGRPMFAGDRSVNLPVMLAALALLLGTSLSGPVSDVPAVRPPVDPLEAGFLRPPNSAKPMTWWHWIDGNITKEGIAARSAAMHRVGIQGAQILDVGLDYPAGPVAYMSPQRFDLVRFAAEEAHRLGMDLGVHNSAGWSSSGGPWVTPEHAMQTVVTSETRVTGGKELRLRLERPPT
ncbi:glycoside hydrolase, partial [bacterium]